MQSLVQSPAGHELQETAHDAVPTSDAMAETSRRWTNLLVSGALTPGLLSVLALSVGFGGTLAFSPTAQAEPTRLAANEATGPQVAFQQPTHADQLNGDAQISISIRGQRYPAKWVELLVDDYAATKGGPVQLDTAMLPIAHFNWNTKVYADGPHKLSVIVTDSQGFKGRADVQVYINNKGGPDVIPPTVRWLNVRNGDVLRGNFPVQLEAKDNFGVKWVIVSLNPAISPTMKPALRGALLNIPPYIFQLNTSGLPASRYVLNAEAYDALDNVGRAPSLEVLIGNGNFTYVGPNIIEPPKPIIDLKPGDIGPSGGATNNGENANVAPQSVPTLNRGSQEGGASDVLPAAPSENPLPERTSFKGQVFAAAPKDEARSLPAMTKVTRAASPIEGAASKPVLSPSTLPKRAALMAKLNAAQPEGALRAMPRAGDVSTPARNLQTLPPLAANVTEMSSASRSARNAQGKAQSSVPQAENRVAALPAATPNKVQIGESSGTPQLSRSALASASSNVARGESHAIKAPVSVAKLPSVPDSTPRALPKTASLPQLTHSSALASSGIATSFPVPKARIAATPVLPILPPAAVKMYPQMPSPNLTGANAAAPLAASGAQKALPVMPMPSFAMNAAMPKTGEMRPLDAITVAPVAQWGTKAELLPTSHTVLRNESLNSIAQRYKMPVAVLAAANNLKLTSAVPTGAKLNLPRALQVTYGGQPIKADAASFMMGSVGVTPFRFLFEKQGGKLDWDAKTRKVTAKGPQGSVELTIGSRTATINQKETLMDLAAFLMSGRTIVPVRFFEQALHAQVEWDPATGRLYVAMTGPACTAPTG